MDIGEWAATRHLNAQYRRLRELGLETHVAELEAFGFTVVEDVLSPKDVERLKVLILEAAQERGIDLAQAEGDSFVPFLLFRDQAFEAAVLNPKPLALITYLLGDSCLLSHVASFLKAPGGRELPLHCDGADGVPAPFSSYSRVANCNYVLTDYSEAGGALAIVPGSHRLCRSPAPGERALSGPGRNTEAIPVEAKAGSVIIWHGNTWHGSFRREQPGLRPNLAVFFCRRYMRPLEDYRRHIPPEALERVAEGTRLEVLLDLRSRYGWGPEGPPPRPSYLEAVSWQA